MPIITSAMKTEQLADAFVGREHEVASYQINIGNYTVMLADLPLDEWPAELAQYRGIRPADISADVDLATVMQINDYQYRDRLRILLRTENCEMNKTQRVKDALDGQLPAIEADKTAAIDAAVVRRDAAIAAAKT